MTIQKEKMKRKILFGKSRNQIYKFACFLLITSAILYLSCGYSIGSRPFEDTSTKSVFVLVFENHTRPYKPGIEVALYNSLVRELMLTSYSISQDSSADLSISGEIIGYKQTVLSTDENQNPTEIQIELKIKLQVISKNDGEKNYVIEPKPEPFAVVRGESATEAELRGLNNVAMQIVSRISGSHLFN